MNKNKLIIIIGIFLIGWILTRPNIYKPFSPYSAYDEGYKRGYGSYPKSCPSTLCKVHGKGFWGELFSK